MDADRLAEIRGRCDEWWDAPIEGHGLWARYQDARDLIPELVAAVEALALRANDDAYAHVSEMYHAAESQVSEQAQVIEGLREALGRYGEHHTTCDAWPYDEFPADSGLGRCTCGLDAAMASLPPKETTP